MAHNPLERLERKYNLPIESNSDTFTVLKKDNGGGSYVEIIVFSNTSISINIVDKSDDTRLIVAKRYASKTDEELDFLLLGGFAGSYFNLN
jgi:hypothetical protein